MFRIGEFSKIAQVPGSVLRYYDDIGLLKPDHIDKWTGYRYYSAQQLPRLHRILALKELGLTLDQITRLVNEDVQAAEIRGMLALRKAQVEQTVQAEMARLRQIEAHLQVIDLADAPTFDIVLKSVPQQHYLSLRTILPSPDDALSMMGELVEALPVRLGENLEHFATVVHSETLESDHLDIELGAVLLNSKIRPITLPGNRVLKVNVLSAVEKMATVLRVGGFENNCRSYGTIGLWVAENGYNIVGPGREVLIKPPRVGQLDDMVTEIQFPVEPRGDHPH